jgi:tungstate transport system substrate-binding protein
MRSMRVVVLLSILFAALFALAAGAAEPVHLKLATTTSTVDTGLFDYMLPKFEAKTGIKVDVISVGTGKAIKLGENGDADVILVHDRPGEDKFIAGGFGVNRRDVMHNEFVLVGPADDPAQVAKATSAVDAFARMGKAGVTFVSRGDDSGTNRRELEMWKAAGVKAEGKWYLAAGQGMGAVLRIADEKKAYTLSDNATWAKLAKQLALKKLYAGDKSLYNPYGVILVNPAKHKHVKQAEGMKFIEWLTGPEGQQILRDYKVEGQTLFIPDAIP